METFTFGRPGSFGPCTPFPSRSRNTRPRRDPVGPRGGGVGVGDGVGVGAAVGVALGLGVGEGAGVGVNTTGGDD